MRSAPTTTAPSQDLRLALMELIFAGMECAKIEAHDMIHCGGFGGIGAVATRSMCN